MNGIALGTHDRAGSRLRLAVLLTSAVLLVELAGGLFSHSLALLADAGHVAADVFALALAWLAVEQSKRPADSRRTYGYHRIGILGALANALALMAIVGVIVYEAARRLAHPEPVAGGVVIATALVAIAVNAYIGWTLHLSDANLTVRAALWHVLGDLAAAAGVVVAGAVILLTGWLYADPLISIGIAGLIAWGALLIVREALNVLLEGSPRGLDLGAVEALLLSGPGVVSAHDLHVWIISPEHPALSVHLVVEERSVAEGEHLVRDLEQRLCDRFGIGHTTIQLETCHPCSEEDLGHGVGDHTHPHPATR